MTRRPQIQSPVNRLPQSPKPIKLPRPSSKMLISMQHSNIMIGKDDNQEEVSFKVADRRKFNADGSLKEGVTLEPAPEKPAAPIKPQEAATPPAPAAHANDFEAADGEEYADDDIPGADDPASFVNFLSTI